MESSNQQVRLSWQDGRKLDDAPKIQYYSLEYAENKLNIDDEYKQLALPIHETQYILVSYT